MKKDAQIEVFPAEITTISMYFFNKMLIWKDHTSLIQRFRNTGVQTEQEYKTNRLTLRTAHWLKHLMEKRLKPLLPFVLI